MAAKIRPSWILGAGAVAAAAAILPGSSAPASGGGAVQPIASEIAGAPLGVPLAPPSPVPQLAARAAPTPVEVAPVAVAPPVAPPSAEAALAGQIDLARMQLVGDHYEAALPDGRRAILTIDPALQRTAEQTLVSAKAPVGAIVLTAVDGRILAIAGRRADSPKGGKAGSPDWSLTTTAWAPAASIFKIVTASALVEAGVDPSDKVCFHGGLRSVTASNLTNDKGDDRCEDLGFAVAYSQNAIIAKLAHEHLTSAVLDDAAQRLGIDGPLAGFALTGVAGKVDVPADDLEMARTAAGFRNSALSPIGGAILVNAIANHGEVVTPRLVEAIIDASGVRTDLPGAAHRRAFSDDIAIKVGHMMEQTCSRGTAAKTFRSGENHLPNNARVAGKTGTLAVDGPPELEYSWFVGYAPADHPAVSIAVVLGNATSWWMKGHTAARMVLAKALAPHDKAIAHDELADAEPARDPGHHDRHHGRHRRHRD
jgi:cell division protein FtsI/penicillin-binding protein 2